MAFLSLIGIYRIFDRFHQWLRLRNLYLGFIRNNSYLRWYENRIYFWGWWTSFRGFTFCVANVYSQSLTQSLRKERCCTKLFFFLYFIFAKFFFASFDNWIGVLFITKNLVLNTLLKWCFTHAMSCQLASLGLTSSHLVPKTLQFRNFLQK